MENMSEPANNDKLLRILQGAPGKDADHGHVHEHEDKEEIIEPAAEHAKLDLAGEEKNSNQNREKSIGGRLRNWRKIRHFDVLLHREFPRQASEWDDAVDRRDFLKLMGASLALAGMAGCGRPDEEHITPYVKQPDGMTLGRPNFYATAMPFSGDAVGVLVESHEGRPTKIEGNPDHPSSLGSTNTFVQASILNLYDPDRAQTVLYTGEIRAWSAFLDAAQSLATGIKAANGEGFRILTGSVTSPTMIWRDP